MPVRLPTGLVTVPLSKSIPFQVRPEPSAKHISVRTEWLGQSGRAPSEPSETPGWQITPCPASIPCIALHIALRLLVHRFLCSVGLLFSTNTLALKAHCDVGVTVNINAEFYLIAVNPIVECFSRDLITGYY
jgi:hypothetical protein